MRRLSAKWMSNMPDSREIGPDAGPQTQRLSWTQLDGERQLGGMRKKPCAVADRCEAVAGSRLASEQLHCSEMWTPRFEGLRV